MIENPECSQKQPNMSFQFVVESLSLNIKAFYHTENLLFGLPVCLVKFCTLIGSKSLCFELSNKLLFNKRTICAYMYIGQVKPQMLSLDIGRPILPNFFQRLKPTFSLQL